MEFLRGHRRDLLGGALIVCCGLFIAGKGATYDIGTAAEMGPGFFPVALGSMLCIAGVIIALTALADANSEPGRDDEEVLPPKPDWRGWGCILSGVLSFIVFGTYLGLLPAIFACVFISAMGDRSATWRSSFALAAGLTVFGVVLFDVVLHTPLPALRF